MLRGDAGIGKTALLDYAAATAGGFQVVRGTGIESEAELPFAGLHLLLRPALDRIAALVPSARRSAAPGPPGWPRRGRPDRLLIGMAVLSLLSELAGEGPLLCLVDARTGWTARQRRRWRSPPAAGQRGGIALIMAARDGEGRFSAQGLPELRLAGLPPRRRRRSCAHRPARQRRCATGSWPRRRAIRWR